MSQIEESTSQPTSKIISLTDFRQKKAMHSEVARGRNPLFVSHLDGKVKSASDAQSASSPDMGERLQRIRSSLQRINQLMGELKKLSQENGAKEVK